jgi:hypothetical protein
MIYLRVKKPINYKKNKQTNKQTNKKQQTKKTNKSIYVYKNNNNNKKQIKTILKIKNR